MDELRTTTEVMEALGGYKEVAFITGRTPKATSNWHRFESFPPDTYIVMTQALKDLGQEAPMSLWRMKEPTVVSEGQTEAAE